MKYIILLMIILGSCKAPEVLTERIFSDTTIIRETTKIVTIPGQTAQSPKVNLDSLVNLLKSGVKPEIINKSLYYTDPETNMRIGLILDQMGNLSALCETQEQTIELMEREIERLRIEQTTTTITKKPSFLETLSTSFKTLLYLIIAIIAIATIYRFTRR